MQCLYALLTRVALARCSCELLWLYVRGCLREDLCEDGREDVSEDAVLICVAHTRCSCALLM